MLTSEGSDVSLTGLQGNQSAVAGVGDGDNSLSMRRGLLRRRPATGQFRQLPVITPILKASDQRRRPTQPETQQCQ
jgi:hypothetical protein